MRLEAVDSVERFEPASEESVEPVFVPRLKSVARVAIVLEPSVAASASA